MMMDEDHDDLGWHALNYRTAASQHAEVMWQELLACVERKVEAKRERLCSEFDLVLARQKIAYEREIEIDVAAERERCADIVLNAAKHGCCCSDSEALAAVIRAPNVEFSGVPAGHLSNHPDGGTSAGTRG